MTPDEALDKMAENARELGLDYEPWEKFCDSNCVWTDHHPDCKLAQRTWVGLTPEEYPDVRYQRETYYAGIKWAEDRLREKNT